MVGVERKLSSSSESFFSESRAPCALFENLRTSAKKFGFRPISPSGGGIGRFGGRAYGGRSRCPDAGLVIQIWSSAFSLFPEFDFVFPFPHTLRFPFSPGKFLHFSAEFTNFQQFSVISRNSGKIPWNFRRKNTDLSKFQRRFAKISKNHYFSTKISKKSANFEFGAVRRNANLVDLKKCWKISIYL